MTAAEEPLSELDRLRQRVAELEARSEAPSPEAGLREALDDMFEGLQLIDRDFRYVYLNRTAAEHGRRPAAELVGRRMGEAYPGIEETEVFRLMQRCLADDRPQRLVNRFVYPDGRAAWFDLRISPVPLGLLVLSIDITARREAEEALARAERLGALGQLSAGIAHDLANVLCPLVLDVENLRESPLEPRLVRSLGRMSRYLQVGTDMIERLRRLAVAAPQAGQGPVDPGPAIRDALELCAERAHRHRVVLRRALDPLPWIVVGPSDLTSALVNLIYNAIDAQPGGGAIDVRTGTGSAGQARIEVADEGPGVPEALRGRVFEPFFTTKGDRGTGLGLANVQAFALRHGGTVELVTGGGAGATFRLEFPPAPAPGSAR